jgi:hypothetical protein
MSRNTGKRGASSKARSSSPPVTREVEPDSTQASIVFGVLGDTFSLSGQSRFFRGDVLAEVLLHSSMPAKLLHHVSTRDSEDVTADVIVVPDHVYTQHDGKLSSASLGLESQVVKRVLKANSYEDTKYVPLSHFFACLPKTEQKKVMSKLSATLSSSLRPSPTTINAFLKSLPSLCLSGQVRYAHKNVSKAQLAELLNELGIAHSRDCATEDSVILGDSNQAAKYLDGTNISVLNMWQFQALQSLKTHESIAVWFQSIPSGDASPSSSSSSTAAASAAPLASKKSQLSKSKRAAQREQDAQDDFDMDDVIPVKPRTKSAAAVASSKPKARTVQSSPARHPGHVGGYGEEDVANDDVETPAFDYAVEGENEDMAVWDRILF